MFGAKRLAEVMAANIAAAGSDITPGEVIQIARVYVRLHNRLYPEPWDERRYLEQFLREWAKLNPSFEIELEDIFSFKDLKEAK